MSDCENVAMREQLPELLHDRLSPDARRAVEQHVLACALCAAELDLLRRVHALTPARRLDAARIVAAIPPYRPAAPRPAGLWRRVADAPGARIAAGLILIVGLAALWSVSRAPEPRRVAETGATTSVSGAEPTTAAAPVPRTASQAVVTAAEATPQLSLGEPLVDLSDSDLRALAETVDRLDALPPTDVESGEPLFLDIEGQS